MMDKLPQYYVPHLEWEVISENEEITHLEFVNKIYSLPSQCVITWKRNEDYGFLARLSGTITDKEVLEPKRKPIPGAFLEKEVVIGYTRDKLFKYECSGFYINSYTLNPVIIGATILSHFTAEINVDDFVKTPVYGDRTEEKIQEWFLSSKIDIFFPRSTSRKFYHATYKIRDEIDEEKEIIIPRETTHSSGRDFLKVNYNNTSFLIAQVPREFGPKWSYNICIEYRKSLGVIPNEAIRKSIAEFVGFIFGTHLLAIGCTWYDEDLNITNQQYTKSWVINAKYSCSKSYFTPMRISRIHNSSKIESIIDNLLPNYISQKDELRLGSILAKYWVSNTIYVGENLPILSSAIEMLADTILKQHKEFKQYYIEYKAFNLLIADELQSISTKLEGTIGYENILKKIKGAASRGSNDKLKMMFEVLNLKVGKIEMLALNTRNKMAHSTIDIDDEQEIITTVKLSRAYQTLFHRIFLKILNYNGPYIDYYSIGHKERHIDEVIGD